MKLPTKKPRCLHTIIQSFNIVSLKKHKDNILFNKSLMLLDILYLQETRLHQHEIVSLGNFKSINSNGAHGVAMHYSQNLKLKSQHIKQTCQIELLHAHFIDAMGKNIHIATLYKSPKSSPHSLIDILQTFFLEIHILHPLLAIGDYNIDARASNFKIQISTFSSHNFFIFFLGKNISSF